MGNAGSNSPSATWGPSLSCHIKLFLWGGTRGKWTLGRLPWGPGWKMEKKKEKQIRIAKCITWMIWFQQCFGQRDCISHTPISKEKKKRKPIISPGTSSNWKSLLSTSETIGSPPQCEAPHWGNLQPPCLNLWLKKHYTVFDHLFEEWKL